MDRDFDNTSLESLEVGATPVVRHFLERLQLAQLFGQYLPPNRTEIGVTSILGKIGSKCDRVGPMTVPSASVSCPSEPAAERGRAAKRWPARPGPIPLDKIVCFGHTKQ
jgi:hypothetical protein